VTDDASLFHQLSKSQLNTDKSSYQIYSRKFVNSDISTYKKKLIYRPSELFKSQFFCVPLLHVILHIVHYVVFILYYPCLSLNRWVVVTACSDIHCK